MTRSAAALALVCSACGALDPAPAPPPIASDGLAPWAEPTPLELCLDGARVVPPTDPPAPAGFCVSSSPPACVTDAHCASGERCACGRCALALCRSDRDCAAGSGCDPDQHRCARQCVASTDCGAAGLCRTGFCAARCARRSDCGRSELCDDLGRCVAQPCRADDECGGDRCDAIEREATLREPSVLIDGARAVLYAERTGVGILRAVSDDGVRFRAEPAAPVLDASALAPTVVRAGGQWWMAVAREGGIALSRSADGVRWEAPRAVLAAEGPGEAGGLGSPALASEGASLTLAYVAGGAIGLATLTPVGDGFGVVRGLGLTAAAVTDPVLWRAVEALDGPMLLRVTEPSGAAALRLYFSARGAEASQTASAAGAMDPVLHRSVGVAARLPDGGFRASGLNPIVARGYGLAGARNASEPTVYALGGRWHMLLRGSDLAGRDDGLLHAAMR